MGKRQRGICADYTRDIGERLKELRLKTLVLHWGAAYANTSAENNCLVVTARNQPFEEGIIMDAWRHSGKLFWSPLKKDTAYRRVVSPFLPAGPSNNISAWEEDLLYTAWLHDYKTGDKWQWQPVR